MEETNRDSSNDTDKTDVFMIKVKVKDAHKSKDYYLNYFEDEQIKTGDFKEETMILDGWQKLVYIEYELKQGKNPFFYIFTMQLVVNVR